MERTSASSAAPDVQARVPAVPVGLSRVGVTGVEKVIRIRDDLFFARLDCFVDLGSEQKGAHMSRFEEVINEAIGEVVLDESSFRAETLAQHIAEQVRERQGARRAEVAIAARYPEHKPAPVSGDRTPRRSSRCWDGPWPPSGERAAWSGCRPPASPPAPAPRSWWPPARASACSPTGSATRRSSGFSTDVPVATHNQRGLGTLHVGCTETCEQEIDASTLLAIVEGSMSSEIYELMKRSDEVAVVEKAHRRPRFVEDCVREMVGGVVGSLARAG